MPFLVVAGILGAAGLLAGVTNLGALRKRQGPGAAMTAAMRAADRQQRGEGRGGPGGGGRGNTGQGTVGTFLGFDWGSLFGGQSGGSDAGGGPPAFVSAPGQGVAPANVPGGTPASPSGYTPPPATGYIGTNAGTSPASAVIPAGPITWAAPVPQPITWAPWWLAASPPAQGVTPGVVPAPQTAAPATSSAVPTAAPYSPVYDPYASYIDPGYSPTTGPTAPAPTPTPTGGGGGGGRL